MLIQPSPDVALPVELQAAIEQSRNLVTVNEAEAIRLRELAISSQYTVNELHKQKVELEAQVDELRAVSERLRKEAGDLEMSIVEKKQIVEAMEQGKAVFMEQMNKEKNEVYSRETAVSEKEMSLHLLEDDLSKKRHEVEAIQADLQSRESRIKEFAQSLCS